jgi:hypothetical protein
MNRLATASPWRPSGRPAWRTVRGAGSWSRRGTRKLLEALRQAPVEAQLVALRTLYECVEAYPGRLVFRYRLPTLEPVERALPRYWSPVRGKDDVGF